MLKNSVFRVSVNTKNWLKKAGIRAVKTFFQTFVAMIGTVSVLGAVDWKMVLSASVLSAILSIATSIAGIPEAAADEVSEVGFEEPKEE